MKTDYRHLLTEREMQLWVLVATTGKPYKLLAESMGCAFETVHFHMRGLFKKLRVRSRHELVVSYFEQR